MSGAPVFMQDGLCAQTDPDAFYPERGASTRAAKAVCVGCPVRLECLTYAVERGERFGVWGGMSERERRRLIKSGAPIDVTTPETPGHQAA